MSPSNQVRRPIERLIAKIGKDISIARRVRKITAEDFAERIGCSRATLHRLESGDAGVSLNTLAMALHALGRLEALADIADPRHDYVTMSQMMEAVPQRVSKPRNSKKAAVEGDVVETAAGKFVGF